MDKTLKMISDIRKILSELDPELSFKFKQDNKETDDFVSKKEPIQSGNKSKYFLEC